MLAAVPHLRAFAISLSHNHDYADDLVQTTLMQALASISRFESGTNINAWLFTILRNAYFSDLRKRKREVNDYGGTHAARLAVLPAQDSNLDFADMRKALARVRAENREALLLVCAEGLSYEEAAEICGVALGTVKSRVHTARAELARLLKMKSKDELSPDRTKQAAVESPYREAA